MYCVVFVSDVCTNITPLTDCMMMPSECIFVFRSEGLVVPEEPGVEGLGRPVSSDRETSEGETSSQTGGAGGKGTTTFYQ